MAHPLTVSPTLVPGQRGGHPWPKCASFTQSRDKKIYNLGGTQGWAQAVSCVQALVAFSARVAGSAGGHPGVSKSRILGAGDLGSLEQQGQRHWWAHVGLVGGPGVWFFGTWDRWPVAKPDRSSPLDSSPNTQGQVAVAYGCGQAVPWQGGLWGTEGQSGVRGPATYESSPRISFTKAAMSVFLVLCKVKKGCSWWDEREQSPLVRVRGRGGHAPASPYQPQALCAPPAQDTFLLPGKLLLIHLGPPSLGRPPC